MLLTTYFTFAILPTFYLYLPILPTITNEPYEKCNATIFNSLCSIWPWNWGSQNTLIWLVSQFTKLLNIATTQRGKKNLWHTSARQHFYSRCSWLFRKHVPPECRQRGLTVEKKKRNVAINHGSSVKYTDAGGSPHLLKLVWEKVFAR